MMMRAYTLAGLCLALLAPWAETAENPGGALFRATDLATAPGGERVAVLLPGARLRVLEARDGWARVSLEGWIRTEGAPPAPAPEAAQAAPPAPAAATASAASLAGAIFVTDERGRTTVGAHLAVRLLSDPQGAAFETSAIRAECDAARAALREAAAALQERAEHAMKTIENPSRAFEAYDEARRLRGRKLDEMKQVDLDCGERLQSALDARAALRALSDGEGRYAFEQAPPGRYTVHASLEAGGIRHEWDVDTLLEAGQRVTLDLTNANRARSEPLPDYR